MAEDEGMVKIMQSLGLDYSPAINSTIKFEKTVTDLQAQLIALKATAGQTAKDINISFEAELSKLKSKGLGLTVKDVNNSKVILDQYGNALKTVQNESLKSSQTVNNFTAATKKHGQAVKDVAQNYNILGNEFSRRSQWFLTGSLFYGMVSGAQQAVKSISDVEMGVTEIARVMEDSSFVFKDYRDSLLQFGVDYGQVFDNVQDIASRWAQAGYNVKDSLENTKTSLLALNTAELDAKSATEDLIGIMSQWQLTSSDLPLLLDKVNKTADDFTVTSQDLVDGLLRSSGAAKIMGMSIDQTISLLTVMREASGRTGREVGNALNSILSYVQRPIAIKTLEDNGIQVFADNAKTQFRNVMAIFQDMAAKWPTLSAAVQDGFVKAADDAGLYNEELANAIGTQQEWNDLQQRDLSQAAAGVYRRNYFIGMIERLSGAQKVLNNMTDAAGYSEQENARTMDTLSKKYESLKASATQLAVSLGDSGLTETLKLLADGGTAALQAIEKLPKPVQDGVLAFASMFAVLKTGQYALKMFGITAGTTAAASKVAAGAMGEMTAATMANTAATNAATTASKGFMAANKWLLIISAAVSAISIIAGAVTRYKEEQNKLIETTKKNIESLSEQKKGLQDISSEYEALKSKEQNLTATADEKKKLLDVQKQLVSQYGVSVTGINAEGDAYSDSIELIRLRTKALEDELVAEQKKLENTVNARDIDDVEDLENNLKKRTEYSNKLLEKQKEIDKYQGILQSKGQMSVGAGGGYAVVDANTDYGAGVLKEYIANASKEKSTLQSALDSVNTTIKTGTANRQQLLQNDASTIIKQLQDNGVKISDSSRVFASEFAKSLALQPKDIQTQRASLKEFIDQLNSSDFDEVVQKYNDFKSKGDSKGIDESSKAILDLVHTFAAGKPELDNFVLTMESTFGDSSSIKKAVDGAIPNFKSGIESLSATFFDSKSTVYGLNNEIKNLNQILDDVNSGNALSAEKVAELTIQYPELASAIHQTAKGYTVETSALEVLRQARITEQTEAMKTQLGITNATTNGLAQRLKIYGIEIDAIKTLNDARTAAQNIVTPPENMRGIIPDSAYKNAEDLKNSLYDYGEALDFISSLEDKLKNPDYGVTENKNKNKTENKALDNALKQLEHRKKMSEETVASIQSEISELKKINSAYAKSADEHADMSERIYDAEKRLKDKRLQNSVNWINEQKELGKLSTQQEIDAWNRVLKNQSNNTEAVKQATQNLYKLKSQLAEETATKETSSIEHWAKLGIYSVQQQIDKYRELYKIKANDQAEEYQRTENLFNLYKDLLNEQQSAIKDAYDERIKQIETETKTKIDAIEEQEKALDRSEGTHDYNNEMADLKQQLSYWSVRTSEDARQKVADLNKQIAEKEHDREVEIKKQTLEDNKDAVQKAADKEKDKWEASYKLIEKAFDEHSLDIVAMAGTMSQNAYKKWVDNYLTPLQTALKSGNLNGFEDGSGKLQDSIDKLPSHDWGMSDTDYQTFRANSQQWATLSAQGYKEATNKAMQQLHTANDALRKKYGRDPSKGEIPTFGGGGKALTDGLATLHKGEIVFPPNLSAVLENVMTTLKSNSSYSTSSTTSNISNSTDRRVILQGPLFNSEKTVFEDDTDETSLANELARAIKRL